MSRIQTYIYAYRYMYIFWRKCIHRNWWRKTHFFPVFLLFLHWLLGKSLRVHTHFASNCLCNHKAFVWLFHSYIFSRIQIQIHRWKMYKLYVLTVRSADFSLHFRYIFTHAASVCAGVCMCVRVCVCVSVCLEKMAQFWIRIYLVGAKSPQFTPRRIQLRFRSANRRLNWSRQKAPSV